MLTWMRWGVYLVLVLVLVSIVCTISWFNVSVRYILNYVYVYVQVYSHEETDGDDGDNGDDLPSRFPYSGQLTEGVGHLVLRQYE